jgi:serine/threonine protein phosphatase 1
MHSLKPQDASPGSAELSGAKPRAARIIAMGDVHGCLPALEAIFEAIDLAPDDTLVTLGDYIDRGPDSKGVVDALLAVAKKCRLIPILGNHEEMLLAVLDGRVSPADWLRVGGLATLESYGPRPGSAEPLDREPDLTAISAEHIAFFHSCRAYHETDTHLLLHANYDPDLPLAQQNLATIRWRSLRDTVPGPHCSGKIAIVGHTPSRSGEIFDIGYLKCLDTYCFGGGWLTALCLTTGQVWQANRHGALR